MADAGLAAQPLDLRAALVSSAKVVLADDISKDRAPEAAPYPAAAFAGATLMASLP
jgi:hypothetical protein